MEADSLLSLAKLYTMNAAQLAWQSQYLCPQRKQLEKKLPFQVSWPCWHCWWERYRRKNHEKTRLRERLSSKNPGSHRVTQQVSSTMSAKLDFEWTQSLWLNPGMSVLSENAAAHRAGRRINNQVMIPTHPVCWTESRTAGCESIWNFPHLSPGLGQETWTFPPHLFGRGKSSAADRKP